jgi:hypothetical protein
MERLPEEDEDDCIEILPGSNAEHDFTSDLLASLISPCETVLNIIVDEAREELTVVPLMKILKDAMKLVSEIDIAYAALDTKASEIASAFSKVAPEHYATIDFMRYLLKLTDSLLDQLPQGRESNLVVLLEHFESCPSTKIVTNMTVQGMEEEQHETEGEIVSSSSSNFERKRGGSFPNVSEINVNFLAVLANKINQQVYMMRVEKCKTKNELQQLVSAPIFNPTKSTRLSQKLVAEFTGPVLEAVNAKLAILSNDAPGDDEEEEEEGKNDNNAPPASPSKEEKQEGGDWGSASKRPRIDTEHPQEEIIKITKQKQENAVHVLPTNPLISGVPSTSFPDLKNKVLVEEVRRSNSLTTLKIFFSSYEHNYYLLGIVSKFGQSLQEISCRQHFA